MRSLSISHRGFYLVSERLPNIHCAINANKFRHCYRTVLLPASEQLIVPHRDREL